MSEQPVDTPSSLPTVRIPVRRTARLLRGLLLTPLGLYLINLIWRIWPSLVFVPTAVSNRITDYALAVVLVLLAAVGFSFALAGLRWLLFLFWPARLHIVADSKRLCIPTGPIGRLELDWERMSARYSFEVEPEELGEGFDSLMDEDEEPSVRLPLLRHPALRTPVNDLLTAFAGLEEGRLVGLLRPYVERVRRRQAERD